MSFSIECVHKGCVKEKVVATAMDETFSRSNRKIETDTLDIQSLTPKRFMKLMKRSDSEVICLYPKRSFNRKLDRYQKKVLAILKEVKSDDHDKFMKKKPEYSSDELKKRIPEAYHSEIEVFMRGKADELAPHRKEDHQINLIPGAEPPFIRNYKPMSEKELEAVKHYLDEHLQKGFIRPSSSKAAAPVLLVKKPGGGLRFCVDYRALNEVTVRNRYPIPLVNETLAKLSRAKWFTKVDVIHAFNKMRIREGDEWLTAFNTRYGQFEYLVMPFGLCNAPATFQSYINSSLQEYLDQFTTAYLDDVLIYSETKEEHEKQVLKVLRRLRERGLQLDIDKCEFFVSEVKYLGMYVGINGIRMDPEKVEAILNWKTPESVKEVQSFLGFANFYRRFIFEYSKKVRCLTELTKGEHYTIKGGKKRTRYNDFIWSDKCQSAFEELKQAFVNAPILAHYDPTLETWVETDASDSVIAGVLSQMHNGVLRPVAYFSQKLTPAECNYMIYDKELLAIIKSFEAWRPELAGCDKEIKILTDHRNLEYFMATKDLNRRQIRWAEFLSEFGFKIMYRPGKQGGKPDALTRRTQDLPAGAEDARNEYQHQVLLKEDQLDDSIRQNVSLCVMTRAGSRKETRQKESTSTESNTIENETPDLHDPEETEQMKDLSEEETDRLIKEAYQNDDLIREIFEAKRTKVRKLPHKLLKKGVKLAIEDLQIQNDRIYYKTRLLIPQSDELKLHLLRKHHDTPMQGHPGYRAMHAKLLENYYWENMKDDCKRYATNCSICRRSKAYNTSKQGLLAPLPIPQRKWTDISLDFVTKLPKCRRRNQVFENILIIVDRLTKRRLYESMTSMGTQDLFEALKRRVICCYGLPQSIVSDRGGQMTAKLWNRICTRYGIKNKLSSAHHPETDGQTENANKVMKNYLRAYVRYVQDDWVDHLPDAEFAANNHENASTGMTSFFADHGYHPRTDAEPPGTYDFNTPGKAELARADKIIARQEAIQKWLVDHITWAQADQIKHANKSRIPHPEYKVGDLVYMNSKDFISQRQSRSLSSKNVGPWKVIRNIDNKAYELEIPEHLKSAGLTPIFHSWKLHLAPTDSIPGQVNDPDPPILITDSNDEPHEEYELLELVDCRQTKKFGVQYKATYVGSWDEWNTDPPWQPWTDFLNSKDAVLKFHSENPDKPQPPERLVALDSGVDDKSDNDR